MICIYNIALFDLDGTLLNTAPGILLSFNETIKECGYKDILQAEKESIIGPPIDKSFQRIYDLSNEEALKAAAVFRKFYSEKFLYDAKPYDGILDLLEYLAVQGWKTGVATYKRNDYAQRLMARMGITQRCNFVLGSDGGNQTKADIINICLNELGGDAIHGIMVGDTVHDLIGAQKMGFAFLGVTYGFGFKTKDEIISAGAVAAADNVEDMKAFFRSNYYSFGN